MLDALIGGGYPKARSIIVSGGAGSGKTTLGLQFLAAGVRAGEPGILAVVDQKPQHVIDDARRLGWDLDHWTAMKSFRLLDASPYCTARGNIRRETAPSDIAIDLARQVKAIGARRLVIDHFSSLVPDRARTDVREFVRTLMFALEDLGCTTFLTSARAGEPDQVTEAMTPIAAGVLELHVAAWREAHVRTLQVRKMRGNHVGPIEMDLRMTAGEGLVGVGTGEASRLRRVKHDY